MNVSEYHVRDLLLMWEQFTRLELGSWRSLDGSPVWRNPPLIIAVELGERERGEWRGKRREGSFLTDTQKKMYGKLFAGVGRSSEKKQLGWWVWTQSWQHWTNFWWGRMSGLRNTPHNSPLTITSCGSNCSSSSIRWLPYLVAISINSQQIRYCNSIQLTPWRTKSSSVDHEGNQPLSRRVGPQSWGSIPVSQYH